MKLFNKIKNILFDEEEIEIPVITKEEPVVKKEVIPPKVETPPKKVVNYEEEYNERELFNSPQTFNFPAYEETREIKREKVEPVKEETRSSRSLNILEYEKRQKKEKPSLFKKEEEKPTQKPFKPSPVISPVYGIIENHGEVKTIRQSATPKPRSTGPIDVDAIRKKAYGTLEDEIVSTLEKPLEEFYESGDTKTIDELLNEHKEEENPMRDKLDLLDEIEKELDNTERTEKPEINPDDTIESDLFNLIDSMYEHKEGGD